MTEKMFVVLAEHYEVPGLIVRLHKSQEGAVGSAVELTQLILTDTKKVSVPCPSDHWNDGSDVCADCGADLQAEWPETVDAANWEATMERLEEHHGAAHCYVTITAYDMLP